MSQRCVPVPDAAASCRSQCRSAGCRLRVNRAASRISARLTSLTIELGAHENQLRIAFFAPAFGPAGAVRYQYRLEGADKDWSPPTGQRTVNYERLAPGHYRFVVGALTDGAMSERTASVTFHILPPVWQRWWFISIAIAVDGDGRASRFTALA